MTTIAYIGLSELFGSLTLSPLGGGVWGEALLIRCRLPLLGGEAVSVWKSYLLTVDDITDTITRKAKVINPRRACAARVTVVALSFCLSVTTFSAATRNAQQDWG